MDRSRWFRVALVLISLSAVVYLVTALGRLWSFMGDLILILFFSWLAGSLLLHFVNILMNIPHMRRPLAILLVYLTLVVMIVGFAFLVVPATADQIAELAVIVPGYVERIPNLLARVDSFLVNIGVQIDLVNRYQLSSFDSVIAQATNYVTENAASIAQVAASTLFAIGMVIILSFYIVIDGGRRLNEALTVLPPAWEREVHMVLHTFDSTFHGYMRGLLIVSLIYGVGTATVMLSTGLPLALPVAIASSLLLVVPFVGDWLALALPLLVAGLSGDFFTFIVVLAVLLFIQQVMLNLLTPRILGQAVRMPAMLVIISVVMGARLAGIWGAMLGVPAAAVLYSLAVTYGTRIRERRLAREAEEAETVTEETQAEVTPSPETALATEVVAVEGPEPAETPITPTTEPPDGYTLREGSVEPAPGS